MPLCDIHLKTQDPLEMSSNLTFHPHLYLLKSPQNTSLEELNVPLEWRSWCSNTELLTFS